VNVVFGGRVKYPGGDPVFYLSQKGEVPSYYDPNRLDAALIEWTALAEKAVKS
jgi:hypothetical protein